MFSITDLIQNHSCHSDQLLERLNQDRSDSKGTTTFIDYAYQLIRGLLNHDTLILEHQPSSKTYIRSRISSTTHDLQSITSMDQLIQLLAESKSKICLSTSGTEGHPTWYQYSIPKLLKHIRRGTNYQQDRWLLTYHPAHMGGLQVFLQALFNQNPIVYAFKAEGQSILNAIDEYQISHVSATTTFYRILPSTEKQFDSIKRISFGGERFIPSLAKKLKQIFPKAKINNIYATTETGTLFTSENDVFVLPKSLREKVRVINGMLYLHSSLLAKPLHSSKQSKWHASGDYIEWIDSTHFRIESRKSDWVNVAGNRVHLPSIEEVINRIKGVQNCRVYSKQNSISGHLICCKIVLTESGHWDEQKLHKKLQERLPAYQIPRIIEFTEQLPMSNTGKAIRV